MDDEKNGQGAEGGTANDGTKPDGNGTPTVEELLAQLTEWKGHARTWETRAKENKTAADKLAEIEAAKLTTEQKLQKELDDLRKANEAAQVTALRATVAAAKGVPAGLLSGSTEDELNASADALLAFRGPARKQENDADAAGKRGDPIGGKGTQITSRDQLASMKPAEVLAAYRDGRLNGLMK